MKQLQAVALLTTCSLAFAIPAWAQEVVNKPTTEQSNDPINAVVKLEVTTAKSDVHCPWINHTDSSTGSGVVIASELRRLSYATTALNVPFFAFSGNALIT